jgi:hypothetical protein
VQLFIIKDVQTGLVWATKIVTDPFNDIWLYRGAPMALLRRRGGGATVDDYADDYAEGEFSAEAIEGHR